jgi:hypothetical protein
MKSVIARTSKATNRIEDISISGNESINSHVKMKNIANEIKERYGASVNLVKRVVNAPKTPRLAIRG